MRGFPFVLALVLSACASVPPERQRVFLDSTTHSDDPPDWSRKTRTVWEDNGKIFFKATHQVRGDERVNGCFDLARLDAKERLVSEIANEVKGTIDNAQQSISESAEVVLGKVRSGEFQGRLSGLRFTEEYFERYQVGGVERIECHTLGEIKQQDYNLLKRQILERVVAVDARLKEAITQKQIEFFSPRETQGEPAPASPVVAKEAVE